MTRLRAKSLHRKVVEGLTSGETEPFDMSALCDYFKALDNTMYYNSKYRTFVMELGPRGKRQYYLIDIAFIKYLVDPYADQYGVKWKAIKKGSNSYLVNSKGIHLRSRITLEFGEGIYRTRVANHQVLLLEGIATTTRYAAGKSNDGYGID